MFALSVLNPSLASAHHSNKRHVPKLQRLFVKSGLNQAPTIALAKDQAHYLGNVLQTQAGRKPALFNGRDGEWCAELSAIGRKGAQAVPCAPDAPARRGAGPALSLRALKRARLDYMAQKATELGVSALRPVITRHTVAERVKTDRLLANAVEAAEQCGILRVPEVMEAESSASSSAGWTQSRLLIFADEAAPHASPDRGASRRARPAPLPC